MAVPRPHDEIEDKIPGFEALCAAIGGVRRDHDLTTWDLMMALMVYAAAILMEEDAGEEGKDAPTIAAAHFGSMLIRTVERYRQIFAERNKRKRKRAEAACR